MEKKNIEDLFFSELSSSSSNATEVGLDSSHLNRLITDYIYQPRAPHITTQDVGWKVYSLLKQLLVDIRNSKEGRISSRSDEDYMSLLETSSSKECLEYSSRILKQIFEELEKNIIVSKNEKVKQRLAPIWKFLKILSADKNDPFFKCFLDLIRCSISYIYCLDTSTINSDLSCFVDHIRNIMLLLTKAYSKAHYNQDGTLSCSDIEHTYYCLCKEYHQYVQEKIEIELKSLDKNVFTHIVTLTNKGNGLSDFLGRDITDEELYDYGRYLYNKGNNKTSLIVLKLITHSKSLILSKQHSIHNILGLCFINEGNYCMALSEYCSWLYGASEYNPSESDEEKQGESIIHHNLAYVLGTIYDQIEDDTIRKVFLDIAIREVEKAKKLNIGIANSNYYCTLGTLLYNKYILYRDTAKDKDNVSINCLSLSVKEYRTHYEMLTGEHNEDKISSKNIEEKNDAARMYLDTWSEALAIKVMSLSSGDSHSAKLELISSFCNLFSCFSKLISEEAHVELWKSYGLYKLALDLNLYPYSSENGSTPETTLENWDILFALVYISLLSKGIRRKLLYTIEGIPYNETISTAIQTINKYSHELGLLNEIGNNTSNSNKSGSKNEDIVYYTSIANAKHIFEQVYDAHKIDPHVRYPLTLKELENKNKELQSGQIFTKDAIISAISEGGKNCLTVMNVNYMNDPTEGKVLLEYLLNQSDDKSRWAISTLYGESPEQLRDSLSSERFVFLKSFNKLRDKLTMWSTYGGDRRNGGDSNGVCICLNPKTFSTTNTISAKIVDNGESSEEKSLRKNEDDFCLYRVYYLNGKDDPIFRLLKSLKGKSVYLGKKIRSLESNMQTVIREFYKNELSEIVYLFKDASYSQEKELRLIMFRNTDEVSTESICHLPTTPEKLCLKPFFQVYIDEIILGPKLEKADEWIPYFQFELNKIKHIAKKNGVYINPKVGKSIIPYR